MNNKFYWGLGMLIVLLIGVFVFVMVNQHAQIKQLESDANKAEDKANQMKDTPPVAREGFKMVPHGDHWHEVPIDAPDTWQGEPAPVAKNTPTPQPPVTQTYDGPLTYHAELLETNPVKALRLQSEERGHFSAQWIPPFPPEDTEAQAYARINYLIIYYESIGETDNPKYKAAVRNDGDMMRNVVHKYPYGARKSDLMKLGWVNFDEQPYEMYRPNGFRIPPSDYFPKWRSEAEKIEVYKKSGFYDLFMEIDRLEEQGLLPEPE